MQALTTELEEQFAFFAANGYLVIHDFLPPAELAELRARISSALAGEQPQFGDFDVQWEPTLKDRADLSRAQRIRVFFHLCHRDAWFWKYATQPKVMQLIEALLGFLGPLHDVRPGWSHCVSTALL